MSEVLSSGLTLTIPSEADQNWANSIKVNCFQKISEHDHTGSGKGVQIGTNAIASLAVTTAKIADSNVTTAKINDEAVTEAKLDADAATRSTLLVEFGGRIIANGSAAIFETVKRVRMPKAGKVTHISANIQQSASEQVTGGTLTWTLYKNGTSTGKTLTMTNGEAGDTVAITAESFSAGDRLSLGTTTSSVTVTGGSVTVDVQFWGHFTE